MPKGTKPKAKTGLLRQHDGEPRLSKDPLRPSTVPEMPDQLNSTTGVQPVYSDPEDDTADREDNRPA
jgi:hypothetical protein